MACCLLLVGGGAGAADVVDASTLKGKVLLGYQGWFNCPGDGAPGNNWRTWSRGVPGPDTLTVDMYPDLSELDADERCEVPGMTIGGKPAYLYSAFNRKTVVRHFRWMKDYGLDGVLVQRFVRSIADKRAGGDVVLKNVIAGAEESGRTFAIEYDITGSDLATFGATMREDWQYLGFNAGSGYGEVWIRDFNTFIELALTVNDPATIRAQLLPFFRFQGPDGDIVDGVIPAARANVGYQYRRSELEPGLLAHKNTVETDQESSLVLAVARYVAGTGDAAFLDEAIAGWTVRERLRQALEYVAPASLRGALRARLGRHDRSTGATSNPSTCGVSSWDADSHPAIDIYDNALYLTAIDAFVRLPGTTEPDRATWSRLAESIRKNVRKHLWDAKRVKFRPHIYLDRGSPFRAGFDEDRIHYHGGTTVAMEAGLLSAQELGVVLEQMRANRQAVGAGSIGLTVYPVYPEGFFKNPQVRPFGYQNGGDWTWFGGRTIQQLVRHGRVAEAYEDARPMVARALRDGFVEWYDVYNRPQGSREFRGAAGTLGQAIVLLQAWAASTPARTSRDPRVTATSPPPAGSSSPCARTRGPRRGSPSR